MTDSVLVVVLAIVALGMVRYWLLPALWRPITEPGEYQDECPEGGSQLTKYTHSPSGAVRVIRLTDDGEFANRCDLTDVLYEIRNYKGPELIVWYIHGWKHNANPDDSDFKQFTALVKELDEQQHHLNEDDRRHVVGIFIGWDGAVGPALLRNLTFWNRKRAADRISQSAVVTKIIAAAKYARRQVDADVTARDVTLMIGHSFGARILYTATSQVLIDEVQRNHPGFKQGSYGLMEGPADLILLLNPAFEASLFTAMHTIRRPNKNWWERVSPQQQPLVVAISSENDMATSWAFPLGQRLAFATRERQRLTLGNYMPFVTHTLKGLTIVDDQVVDNDYWYDRFDAAGLQLLRTAERQPGNPFIVARTTPEIVDGHNGIWGNALREWLIAFLGELHRKSASTRRATGMRG